MDDEKRRKLDMARARNKRHYLKRLAEGRCVACGATDDRTRAGRARCAACNEKAHPKVHKALTEEKRAEENETKREWSAMRKSAHLCVHCGRQDKRTLNGMSSCLQCATKRNKRQRETYDKEHQKELRAARAQKKRDAGLCTECGGQKEDPNMALCCTCRVKAKLRTAKRKIERGWLPRGSNGMCYQCNREKVMEGKKLCPACYTKKIDMLRRNAAKRYEKQGTQNTGDTPGAGSDKVCT